MFVWVGCEVKKYFAEYREKIKEINAEFGLDEGALKITPHISLKIVFEIEDGLGRHCINDMVEFLEQQKPFEAKVLELENHDGLIWFKVEENESLKFLHNEMDEIAISYAVKRHPLDKEFIFHSTVIMDEGNPNAEGMYQRLKELPYPTDLKINTFLVGHSPDNKNFKLDRRIKVK